MAEDRNGFKAGRRMGKEVCPGLPLAFSLQGVEMTSGWVGEMGEGAVQREKSLLQARATEKRLSRG